MSVFQLKDGRWVCGFRKGRDPERPNSTRKNFGRGEQAKEEAEQFNSGLRDRRKQKNDGHLNFSEVAAMYLSAKMSSMSISDQDNTYYKLNSIIFPRIGHLSVTSIDYRHLDAYVTGRMQDTVKVPMGKGKKKDTGRRVSTSTIHRELSIVRAVINWGVKRRLLLSSPMAGFEMPKRDDKKILPMSQAEFVSILKEASPHCKRMMLITYFTGLRPGREAYNLTWHSVDLDNGTIAVISAKKGGIDSRLVPIHPELYIHLTKWKTEDKGESDKEPDGYLINWNGRQIKTSMKNAWSAAKTRAGITRKLRPYSLRHKAISDMLSAGGDVGAVAEIVGHSDPQMTLRVYQETNTAIKKTAISGLGTTLDVIPVKN